MAVVMPCQRKSSKWHHESVCTIGDCIREDSKKQYMVVQWNLMNPQGNEWTLLSLNIMKTTLQAVDLLRWPIIIWCTSLFLCHKWWTFWMQELQWIKKGKSSRRSQHGNWRKSRARRRLFWTHKETQIKIILLHWWTFIILGPSMARMALSGRPRSVESAIKNWK